MRRCVEGGVGRWPQHTDKYEGVAQLANHSVGIPLAHGSLLGREREREKMEWWGGGLTSCVLFNFDHFCSCRDGILSTNPCCRYFSLVLTSYRLKASFLRDLSCRPLRQCYWHRSEEASRTQRAMKKRGLPKRGPLWWDKTHPQQITTTVTTSITTTTRIRTRTTAQTNKGSAIKRDDDNHNHNNDTNRY